MRFAGGPNDWRSMRMKRLIKQAVLGIAAAGALVMAASPAQARHYGRYYRHHDRGDLALGLGILAVGAALAADRGYYGRPYYGGYYETGYYRPYRAYRPYREYWGGRCFVRRSWDYWGRPVRMRVCR
jgi:hypothetical protein